MHVTIERLLSGLFVDVGNNYSVLEYVSTSFVYDDIDPKTAMLNSGLGTEQVGSSSQEVGIDTCKRFVLFMTYYIGLLNKLLLTA